MDILGDCFQTAVTDMVIVLDMMCNPMRNDRCLCFWWMAEVMEATVKEGH